MLCLALLLLLLACPLGWLGAPEARAQQAPAAADSGTPARADLLFRQWQELIDAGKPAEACPKLEESQRLDPKLGRLLNVAYCHELVGRTASAWAEYNEAAALAAQKGQPDRVEFARQHAAALVDRLSLVQLDFTRPSSAGAGGSSASASPSSDIASVAVDGKPLSREQWAMPFAVDPGARVFTFGAPGMKTHDQQVTVAPGRGTWHVVVDRLEPEAAAPVAAPPLAPAGAPTPAVDAGGSSVRRPLAYVAGGVGVAGVIVGTGFLLHALAHKNDAAPDCPQQRCNAQGAATIDGARTSAWIATAGFGVGVGGAAAAVWLFLTSASGSSSPGGAGSQAAAGVGVRVEPLVGAGGGGLSVQGAW